MTEKPTFIVTAEERATLLNALYSYTGHITPELTAKEATTALRLRTRLEGAETDCDETLQQACVSKTFVVPTHEKSNG